MPWTELPFFLICPFFSNHGMLTMLSMKTTLKSVFIVLYFQLHTFYSSKAKQILYPELYFFLGNHNNKIIKLPPLNL